jgi:hypothetical protein
MDHDDSSKDQKSIDAPNEKDGEYNRAASIRNSSENFREFVRQSRLKVATSPPKVCVNL